MQEICKGKITKGIAGFYYVYVPGMGMFECKAKGIFRKDNVKPLVGDDVEIDIISMEEMTGNICKIFSRKSSLIRPAVANIDQAMIIFALRKPDVNLNLLDRFLIQMEQQGLNTIICFNKADLENGDGPSSAYLADIYSKAGYETLVVSAKEDASIDQVLEHLKGKTTTVAGPSGVGKSTLINRLQSDTQMETGAISQKIERGKHTTRHSQLIPISQDTYILDTPGFSSLSLFDMEKEDLEAYYPEFEPLREGCKFTGCSHLHEPVCGVQDGLKEGKVSLERYENYKILYQELASKKRY